MGLERLDDQDYPVVPVGQAAELVGVPAAFLRSLDTAGLVAPQRSSGGHRRYSRRQLELAARIRALSEQGHTIAGAAAILALRDDLACAQEELAVVREQRDSARAERDQARAERDYARRDHPAPGAHPIPGAHRPSNTISR